MSLFRFYKGTMTQIKETQPEIFEALAPAARAWADPLVWGFLVVGISAGAISGAWPIRCGIILGFCLVGFGLHGTLRRIVEGNSADLKSVLLLLDELENQRKPGDPPC